MTITEARTEDETRDDPESRETRHGVEIAGRLYMRDPRGALVPYELVRPIDRLIDDAVRDIMTHARELSGRIARFRAHTFDDVGALQQLVAEKYGTTRGGARGNVTLTSYDGCQKVTVQVQDQLSFGPELQAAKSLVDECIASWADGADPKLRALVDHAFQVDKEGRINRGALYQLRRLDIEDDRWQAAMAALVDSMRLVGTSTYIRFYQRGTPQDPWRAITIDLAAAR